MTPKNIHKIFILQNIQFFEKKINIENQNYEPQKIPRAWVCKDLSVITRSMVIWIN